MTPLTLPVDSTARKGLQILRGCLGYFPAALAGVARWSKVGNDKHNPGEPLHHARGKSMDHDECVIRHSLDILDLEAALERFKAPAGMLAEDYKTVREQLVQALLDEHDARCWRTLAASQEFREKYGLAPLAPSARLPKPAPLLDCGLVLPEKDLSAGNATTGVSRSQLIDDFDKRRADRMPEHFEGRPGAL